MVVCHQCNKQINLGKSIGRLDVCPQCNADLHVCLNCEFYDSTSYNECREPQAERVLNKEKANFCDYFKPALDRAANTDSKKEKSIEVLENLFKK